MVLTLSLDDEMEQEFRDAAGRYFGQKKGNLSKAATEAFRLWIDMREAAGMVDMPVQNTVKVVKQVCKRMVEQGANNR